MAQFCRFGLTIRPGGFQTWALMINCWHLSRVSRCFGIDPYLRNDYPDITYYVHTHVQAARLIEPCLHHRLVVQD